MLQVDGLTKRYGRITALEDVSFTITEGEVVGLLGENGAGKSTTLGLLSGALSPTSGRVTIGGRDLFDDPIHTKRKVGYLPERLPLDEQMRVGSYLDYVGRLQGLNRRERSIAMMRVVVSCGLDAVVNRSIAVLSRGGRMRVGLAQALIHNPEIVLLDEPTAGLDPQQVLHIRRLILSLSGHHTVVFSSHNLVEVSECCSRVLLIKEGHLMKEDLLADLQARSGEGVTLLVRFSRPVDGFDEHIRSMDGVRRVVPAHSGGAGAVEVTIDADQGEREQFLERLVFQGWGLCEVRETTESLSVAMMQDMDLDDELPGSAGFTPRVAPADGFTPMDAQPQTSEGEASHAADVVPSYEDDPPHESDLIAGEPAELEARVERDS